MRAHEQIAAVCKRVQYQGPLQTVLQSRGVTEQMFRDRMRQRQCVFCASSQHILYACPEYQEQGLNIVSQDGQQRQAQLEQRYARSKEQYAQSKARYRSREQQLWQQLPRPGQAPGEPAPAEWTNPTNAANQRRFRKQFHDNRGGDLVNPAVVKELQAAPSQLLAHYAQLVQTAQTAAATNEAAPSTPQACTQGQVRRLAPSIPEQAQYAYASDSSLSGSGYASSDSDRSERLNIPPRFH